MGADCRMVMQLYTLQLQLASCCTSKRTPTTHLPPGHFDASTFPGALAFYAPMLMCMWQLLARGNLHTYAHQMAFALLATSTWAPQRRKEKGERREKRNAGKKGANRIKDNRGITNAMRPSGKGVLQMLLKQYLMPADWVANGLSSQSGSFQRAQWLIGAWPHSNSFFNTLEHNLIHKNIYFLKSVIKINFIGMLISYLSHIKYTTIYKSII